MASRTNTARTRRRWIGFVRRARRAVARHPRRLVIAGLAAAAAAAAAFETKLLWAWRDCRRPDVQSYPKSYPMCTHVLDVARLHMAGWTVLALVVPLAVAGFVWASATPSIDPAAYRRRRR